MGRTCMFRADSARLIPPLTISLLLHALFASFLISRVHFDGAAPRERSVSVELGRFSIDPTITPTPDSDQMTEGGSLKLASPAASTAPPDKPVAISPAGKTSHVERPPREHTRRLNLSLPPGITDAPINSSSKARIFDPALLKKLNRQRKRSASYNHGLTLPGDKGRSETRFSGGRWETFLQIGDRCFHVLEADPLQPLDTEQWYLVDCG